MDGKKDIIENSRFADAGKYNLNYKLNDLPAGVYIVRFVTNRFTVAEKVVVLH